MPERERERVKGVEGERGERKRGEEREGEGDLKKKDWKEEG